MPASAGSMVSVAGTMLENSGGPEAGSVPIFCFFVPFVDKEHDPLFVQKDNFGGR